MIGQTIAHYKVTDKLGAGGMGEVYRAEDTKLSREVALKVLPEAFTSDVQRMQRFHREAQMLASLNHPNIATIHGLEEAGATRALVMELVEGPTLAVRISEGAIAVEEALPIARQIAEALEYAHERGIIHRDLKPANVKVTSDGKVKVLDFGLAKALEGPISGHDISASPTLTAAATRAGVILGTAAYMSPEQAKGKSVDRRADIWAFGVVLYEMLSGRQLFPGETPTEILALVITQQPDWSALPASTPAPLRRLLERCLTKDPKNRLRDIGEARIAIEDYLANPLPAAAAVPAPGVAPAMPLWKRALPWGLAGVMAGTALFLALTYGPLATRETPLVHAMIPPPKGAAFHLVSTSPGPVAISPDGGALAFVALAEDRVPRLYVRRLSAAAAHVLTGTDGAAYPFWSADGRTVAFFADGKLKKVDAAGGPPVTLCDAPVGKGGTWNRDGVIVFAPSFDGPLHRVSAMGGASAPVTTLDRERGDNSHRHPRFLPDGNRFLYLARSGRASAENLVVVGALDGKEVKMLFPAQAAAEYANGHILFIREQTLMAQPFDPARLGLSGEAAPVAENVMVLSAGAAVGVFSVSVNGTLVYTTGSDVTGQELVWVDRNGNRQGTVGDKADYRQVVLSPDAQKAMVTISDSRSGMWDLWSIDLRRGVRTRFTFDPAMDWIPRWTPDSSAVIFTSSRGGKHALYRKAIAGAGEEEVLFESENSLWPSGVSPDGKFFAFAQTLPNSAKGSIWILPLTGERKPSRFVQTDYDTGEGVFSPDGKWLAYGSDESGRYEVYVTPFPNPSRKWQVSQAGGQAPFWRRDGRELMYQSLDGRMMSVEITARGETLEIGAARPGAEFPAAGYPNLPFWPTTDHQRFLLVSGSREQPHDPLNLVVNWPAKLKK